METVLLDPSIVTEDLLCLLLQTVQAETHENVANGITFLNAAPVTTERRLNVRPVYDLLEGSIAPLVRSFTRAHNCAFLSRREYEGGTDAERRTPRPRTDPLHAIRRDPSAYLTFSTLSPPLSGACTPTRNSNHCVPHED